MNEEQRGVLAMIREGRVLPELTTSREKLKLFNNNELASPHPWKFHQMAGGFVGHFPRLAHAQRAFLMKRFTTRTFELWNICRTSNTLVRVEKTDDSIDSNDSDRSRAFRATFSSPHNHNPIPS